jgi:hypothetical protein
VDFCINGYQNKQRENLKKVDKNLHIKKYLDNYIEIQNPEFVVL